MVECAHVSSLLALDPPPSLSSLAYSMITHTTLVAGNLPMKSLVARQCGQQIVSYAYDGEVQ